MSFTPTISFDGIITAIGMLGTVATLYFGAIRRLDGHSLRIAAAEADMRDLRHGIGLVLPGNWPITVQRCFGFAAKRQTNDDDHA
jgi:hypothetical protein